MLYRSINCFILCFVELLAFVETSGHLVNYKLVEVWQSSSAFYFEVYRVSCVIFLIHLSSFQRIHPDLKTAFFYPVFQLKTQVPFVRCQILPHLLEA